MPWLVKEIECHLHFNYFGFVLEHLSFPPRPVVISLPIMSFFSFEIQNLFIIIIIINVFRIIRTYYVVFKIIYILLLLYVYVSNESSSSHLDGDAATSNIRIKRANDRLSVWDLQ